MRRSAARISVLGTSVFAATVVALLVLVPEIDPMRRGISFYALEIHPAVIGVALLAVGVSGMALAVAVWRPVPDRGGKLGPALLFAWGVSSILAGVFPLDAPDATPTLAGSIHGIVGLNFLLIVPAVILVGRDTRRAETPVPAGSGADVLAWLVAAGAVLLFVFNGPLSSLDLGGLAQRLYWLAAIVWLLLEARTVLQAEHRLVAG